MFYLRDEIKEDEMGRACSMHVGDEKCIQNLLEYMKRRDHLEDLGMRGQFKNWNLRKSTGGVDGLIWIRIRTCSSLL
jgi:hypothetical protein